MLDGHVGRLPSSASWRHPATAAFAASDAAGTAGWHSRRVASGGRSAGRSRSGGPGGPAGPGGGGRNPLPIVLGLVAVALLGIAAVVAFGGDDGGGSSGPPADVALDDLEPALLTEADVGSDFTLDSSGSDDDDDDDPLDPDTADASDECREALEAFEASDAGREEITVEFSNATDGAIDNAISLAQEGQPSLADVRGAMETCGTIGYSDSGTTGEFSFETSDVDGIGDAALGLTVDVTVESQGLEISFEMHAVMWERDGVHGTVSGFGGFDESTFDAISIDPGFVEDLARTSDQRMAEVLSG